MRQLPSVRYVKNYVFADFQWGNEIWVKFLAEITLQSTNLYEVLPSLFSLPNEIMKVLSSF